MKKSDKILVTGASGFIGSRLIKHLYENGFTNLRTTSYSRDLREHYDGIEHMKGNLQNADFCEEVSKNVDAFQQLSTPSEPVPLLQYGFLSLSNIKSFGELITSIDILIDNIDDNNQVEPF